MLLEDVGHSGMAGEDLEEIRAAASAATALTRQLLAFSRREIIKPKVVAIEDIVTNVTKILRRLIGEDIELSLNLASTPSIVRIDPGQLEQVIMNLAVNARDAMPSGGRVTISTSTVTIDAAAAGQREPVEAGRFARLSIADTGSGMDAATRVRIFEPFFTTKGVGKGTGLGLATVYGIVRQSGGRIDVESEPRQGATFTIHLPVVDDAEEVAAIAAGGNVPRGTETVLLVEDATSVRAVIRQILVRYGYEVLEAARGEAALTLARGHDAPIDVLLTDVVMPEMNGRDLAEQVTALQPGIKVLFASGYTDDAVTRHGLGSGSAYIQKPFSPYGLARKLREVLDGGNSSGSAPA
jgi:CheY-like chemotaxis protein